MAVLTDDEKRIVEWLDGCVEDIRGAILFAATSLVEANLEGAAKAAEHFAKSIRNGDHRKD